MITVSVVEAGCMVFVTVVLGWLDEACALQQATTTQMMMGRTIKSTIPAIVPPVTAQPILPIQRDMIITQVKLHIYPSGPMQISLVSFLYIILLNLLLYGPPKANKEPVDQV